MDIKEGIITFITPNNVKIEAPYDKIGEFCEKYCLEYISKSKENKIQFDTFAKNYTYFKPYYDFIICELLFISYPSLVDKKSYVKKGEKQSTKGVIPLSIIKDLTYEELNKKSCSNLLNVADENLGINCEEIDGFFDANGKFLTNKITHYHEEIARVIMSGICIENGFLINDLFNAMSKGAFLYEDYLCQRLGFIISGSYKGHTCMFINPYILTLKQKKIVEEYRDYGYRIIEDLPLDFNIDNTRMIVENFRRGQK